MSAYVVPASFKHADELARKMRMADVLELLAADGLGPLGGLIHSMEVSSYAFALYLSDELAAIWGVRPHPKRVSQACAWILTSEVVDRRPIEFWRWCKHTLPLVRGDYEEIFNFVDARHDQALRWAKKLGFSIGDPEPFGFAGLPFHRISLRRAHV